MKYLKQSAKTATHSANPFCFYYGEDLAERLGCHEVAAKDINLTPRLLKK